ncbi:hypothetical protein BJX70DRAFT_398783 [Aspergillus crustosus]
MAPLSERKSFNAAPEGWEAWDKAARDLKVSKSSINTADKLHSGSTTTQAQHLVSRVLRPNTKPAWAIDLQALNITAEFNQATAWLNQFQPFRASLDSIAAGATITSYGPNDPYDLGLFEHPRKEQLLALFHDPATLTDEDTVNTGLLSLLTSLSLKHPAKMGEWRIQRILLNAEFDKASYGAKLDGYLASPPGKVKILLEAKRQERAKIEPKVSMQETAEIVAWLRSKTGLVPTADRPVLGSQDGKELYLSTATFTQTFLDYLKCARGARALVPKESTSGRSSQMYGPWDLSEAGEVKHFAQVMLAIVLKYGP